MKHKIYFIDKTKGRKYKPYFINSNFVHQIAIINPHIHSTHQEIITHIRYENTPLLFRVFLWLFVFHWNSRYFLMARNRIFSFLSLRRKNDLQIIHTWYFVGITPKSLNPRSQIKNTPFSYHKRKVKTSFFLNR